MGRASLIAADSCLDTFDPPLGDWFSTRYLRLASHTLDADRDGISALTILGDEALARMARITKRGGAVTRSDLVLARRWRDHAKQLGLLAGANGGPYRLIVTRGRALAFVPVETDNGALSA